MQLNFFNPSYQIKMQIFFSIYLFIFMNLIRTYYLSLTEQLLCDSKVMKSLFPLVLGCSDNDSTGLPILFLNFFLTKVACFRKYLTVKSDHVSLPWSS